MFVHGTPFPSCLLSTASPLRLAMAASTFVVPRLVALLRFLLVLVLLLVFCSSPQPSGALAPLASFFNHQVIVFLLRRRHLIRRLLQANNVHTVVSRCVASDAEPAHLCPAATAGKKNTFCFPAETRALFQSLRLLRNVTVRIHKMVELCRLPT